MSDLTGASVDDVKRFFRLYYAPNNATLAIVGDIDKAQTKAWVEKYFADLPRGKPIVRPKFSSAVLPSEKRLTFEDRVQIPRLTIRWPSADQASADAPALGFSPACSPALARRVSPNRSFTTRSLPRT